MLVLVVYLCPSPVRVVATFNNGSARTEMSLPWIRSRTKLLLFLSWIWTCWNFFFSSDIYVSLRSAFHKFCEISINYGWYIVCNNRVWCHRYTLENTDDKFSVLKDIVKQWCFDGTDMMLFLNCSVGSDTREWSCEIWKRLCRNCLIPDMNQLSDSYLETAFAKPS